MRIIVDGLPEDVTEGITLGLLVEELRADSVELIAEVNHRYIHRRDYDFFVLQEGDRVELIQAAFGG